MWGWGHEDWVAGERICSLVLMRLLWAFHIRLDPYPKEYEENVSCQQRQSLLLFSLCICRS